MELIEYQLRIALQLCEACCLDMDKWLCTYWMQIQHSKKIKLPLNI